jgi:hypothetical protein
MILKNKSEVFADVYIRLFEMYCDLMMYNNTLRSNVEFDVNIVGLQGKPVMSKNKKKIRYIDH